MKTNPSSNASLVLRTLRGGLLAWASTSLLLGGSAAGCAGDTDATDDDDSGEEGDVVQVSEGLSSSSDISVAPAMNLALGRPTTQSSTAPGSASFFAVDGNTSNASAARTNAGPSFWQVDLTAVQPIGEVVIRNRTDCCQQQLHDFKVRVSADGSAWEDFPYAGIAGAQTHVTIDRRARFVRIENPEALNLVEVEVLRTRNLAYGRPATQSTTKNGAAAARAVDGNTDGDFGHGSVSHTESGASWWQVDLQQIANIGHVVVFNRTDCCTTRLHDFTVKVSNDNQSWHAVQVSGPAAHRVIVPIDREARFVRIENSPGYLHLAEVQVFEGPRLPQISYGRGVGKVPTACGAGMEYDAGLCYPVCKSGYEGVATLCKQFCASGYTTYALTCTNWSTLHTYSRDVYGRGVGKIPTACGAGMEYDAGLCYPVCDAGYHGVGPVCWMDDLSVDLFVRSACDALRFPAMSDVARESGKALTFGIGAGVSLVATGTGEIGVAYGADGEFGCYATGCFGVSSNISINAYASMGAYRSFADLPGETLVTSLGVSAGIPETPISIGGSVGSVSNMDGEVIGATLSANIGLGLDGLTPIDVSALVCTTGVLQTQL